MAALMPEPEAVTDREAIETVGTALSETEDVKLTVTASPICTRATHTYAYVYARATHTHAHTPHTHVRTRVHTRRHPKPR